MRTATPARHRRADPPAARAGEDRAGRLPETGDDAFVAMDATGSIVEWNAEAARMFGWTRQEALGRPLADTIIPPGHREAQRRGLERLLATDEAAIMGRRLELSALRGDGHEFPVEWTVWAARTGSGQCLNAFIRDVTERKRAEESLLANQQRLATAQHIAGLGSWEWDIGTDAVVWSEEMYRIYGVVAAEFQPSYESFLARVHPDDRGRVTATVELVLDEPAPFELDHRIVRPDGGVRSVHTRGEVVVGGAGRAVRMIGTEQDVTEQQRTAAALRQSEERFRAVFAHAPVAETTLSLDGTFLQANPAMCQMTGFDEPELLGLTLADLTHPEARAEMDEAMARLLAEEVSFFHLEGRLVRRDRGEADVLVAASIVRDAGGRPSCVVALILDITERKATQNLLAHQALHDPLTGLPNRALFIDRLQHGIRGLGRRGGTLAVLFLDLDRFKLVNDSCGHAAGDQVLVAISSRLREVLRVQDTVARFGGDEFAVLCEDVVEAGAVAELAERILQAITAPLTLEGGRQASLSASVGIALTSAADASAELLLRDADSAMYQAKDRGRNRYEIFSQAMRARTAARVEQAEALRRGLDRGELRVFFQPDVEMSTERSTGVEALVRWEHPERGLVGPQEFITVAEETGLIVELGAWVLEEACRQVAAWPEQPESPPLTLSVNLSAHQLTEASLIDTVWRVLAVTGLEPSRLCLEITESVLMEDVELSIEALLGLKALGVRLAIDDFGTGYSSLSYLRRFPVDVVKVDRSFVAGLGVDAAADAIVATVVNLSHALGLVVVAEGVETEEQLVALRALGCDRGQGFRWSPPLPPADLQRWQQVAGVQLVEATAVDLHGLLVQRTEALRAATGRSVVLEMPARLPPAMADAGAVKNVLDQLLRNAVTYSGPDRPVVVSATSDRRWVRFRVADYGIGMRPIEAARCFEQFWQAEATSDHRPGGTGIGLYIVRSLLDAMGGHVSVRSAPGKGSTFTVSLPRSALGAARARAVATASPDVGEQSQIREFMRQIGVPTRRER